MVNTNLFNEALKNHGDRKDGLAAKLGISRQTLSNKINNKTEFKNQEAIMIKDLLRLTDAEFVSIFFAHEGDSQSPCEEA